ncbi:hypothetical protein [Paenibacillus glycinis]|uniref:hypothetical protein n=1 Tax=Paenibacillus glycinis TaxID=2697035 RepID=UPI001F32F653|nr:hypothetical protein [Paenibacillus glycinis]
MYKGLIDTISENVPTVRLPPSTGAFGSGVEVFVLVFVLLFVAGVSLVVVFLPPLLAAAELFVLELLLLQAASKDPVIARIVSTVVTLFLFLIFTHPRLIVV